MNRVTDLAAPNRCQGASPIGQCEFVAVPGFKYCEVHGGELVTAEEEAKRLYHLTEARYRTRLAHLTEHDQIQALREVISLARMLVEKRFNLASRSDTDLFEAVGSINTLQLTIERLVKSAHTIEQNLGVLLSKPTVLRLGQLIIQIVTEALKRVPNGEYIANNIATRMVTAIASANNSESAGNIQKMIANLAPAAKTKPAAVFALENTEDRDRLLRLSTHEKIKSLNEDIAMSILLIEKRWNSIKTENDLINASGQLNTMLRTLERLIKSAHEIEQTMGQLLQPEAQQRVGRVISAILVEELEDVDGYEALIDEINENIVRTLSDPQKAEQRLLGTTPA